MDHYKQQTIIIVEEIGIVGIIANENWNWMTFQIHQEIS
jgi:hypothetical protein